MYFVLSSIVLTKSFLAIPDYISMRISEHFNEEQILFYKKHILHYTDIADYLYFFTLSAVFSKIHAKLQCEIK
jgi:hypothetical protein